MAGINPALLQSVSLEEEPPKPEGIAIFDDPQMRYPESVLQRRAEKFNFATKGEVPVEQAKQTIAVGNEGELRRAEASRQQAKLQKEKMAMTMDVMKTYEGPVDPVTADLIKHVNMPSMVDPMDVFEKTYADTLLHTVIAADDDTDSPFDEALEYDPDRTMEAMDIASDMIRTKEGIQKIVEDLEARRDNMSTGARVLDTLETFIPGYSWSSQSRAIEEAEADAFFQGKNFAQQRDYIFSLPADQAIKVLNETVEEMAKYNINEAIDFARNMGVYSSSSQAMGNLNSVLDLVDAATVVPIAKVVSGTAKVGKAATRATTAARKPMARFGSQIKGVVKGNGGRVTKPADIAAEAGQLDKAAVFDVVDKIRKVDPNNRSQTLVKNLPSLLDPKGIARGASRFTTAEVNDILDVVNRNADKAVEGATDGLLISRVSDEAKAVAVAAAQRELKRRFNVSANNAILDISQETTTDAAGVTSVHYALGTPSKGLFKDEAKAVNAARNWYKLPANSFTVKELGGKYYVDAFRPIDETDPDVRNAQIGLENTTPKSIANVLPLLTSGRTPEEILSIFQRQNRHVAVHGISRLLGMTKDMGEQIGRLSSREKNALNDIMDDARDVEWEEVDSKTGKSTTRVGMEYETLGELEDAYLRRHNRLPSVQETKAYFSAVQLGDLDYFLRNLDLYKAKTRQGIEKISIRLPDDKGDKQSHFFEGAIREKLPQTDEDFGVLVYNQNTLDKSYFRHKNVTKGGQEELNKMINEEGYKVVQIAQPDAKPMKNLFGVNDIVNYMLVKDVQTDQLDWQQIPRRPGGHVVYSAEHYIKQAKVRETGHGSHSYEGDVTAMGFETEAEAIKYTQEWEKARKGEPNDLPFTKEEIDAFFEDEIDEMTGEVIREARFNRDIPFRYLGARQGTNDKYKDALRAQFEDLEDTIDSEHNMYRDIDKEFTGERNPSLWTVEEGTEANPVVKLGKARKLDSMSVINKATSGIIRSRYMNDYKTSAVESFVQEFGDLMRAPGGIKEIRANPIKWLHEPQWMDTPQKERIHQAMAARNAILNLLGTPDKVTSSVQRMFGKLNNQVYEKLGQKSSNWVQENMIPTMVDPFQYTRAVAFHSKLGLFNPTQFFLQYQTVAHTIGVAGPKHAYQGATASFLYRRLMLNDKPQVLDHMASVAQKMGFGSAEDFKESFEALKRSGLWYVEGDVAWLDQVTPPSIITSKATQMGKKALDAGTFFFKESERMVRLTAWGAAYKEWRTANPRKLTDQDELVTIYRAENDADQIENPNTSEWIKQSDEYQEMMKARGGWWTDDKAEAEWYLKDIAKGGNIKEIQLPKSLVEKYRVSNQKDSKVASFSRRPEKELFLPKEVIVKARNGGYPKANQLSDKDIQSILRRQNTLSVNMTRASNASWQKGFMSVPTQFFAYQARLTEQFMGKQLTRSEKLRALLTYSIMYGVPTAGGAAVGVWPIYESVKTALMERGYTDTTGNFNNQVLEGFVDGLVPTMMNGILSAATGKDVDLNISERYGPGGLSIFKEVANGETGVIDLLIGASGSILKDFVTSAEPIMGGIYGIFDPSDDRYPIVAEDYIDAARNISTVNNFAAAIYAWNYGIYLSKNRVVTSDQVNGPTAVMMAITGLSPQEISDTFLMAASSKHLTAVQREAEKVISRYIKLGVQHAQSGDQLEADKYFRAAKHHVVGAGFRKDQYGELFSKAMNGYGSIDKKIQSDFFTKSAPADQAEERFKRYMESAE